jgi:hypothetical protein
MSGDFDVVDIEGAFDKIVIMNCSFEPSKTWTGAIRPRPDVIPDMHTGNFYAGIYASNRERPYVVRIPKRQDNLPKGTAALDA